MPALTVRKVADWLDTRHPVPVREWDPNTGVPPLPDRQVLVSPVGGPGIKLDGAVEERTFALRTVGPQRDRDGAETDAWALDALIESTEGPVQVADVRVVAMWRLGGGPSLLLVDSAGRGHYVANYLWSACR